MAELAAVLLGQITLHPERDPVADYAAAMKWKPLPDNVLTMLNAKVGFVGSLGEQKVMIGGDGSTRMFGITAQRGFDPERVKSHLQGVLDLRKISSDTDLGQTFDLYSIHRRNRRDGALSLTYGVAPANRGVGTVGYVSEEMLREALR